MSNADLYNPSSKKVKLELSHEQLRYVVRGLEFLRGIFEMRAKEAMTGAFSPDNNERDEAQRELDIVNSALKSVEVEGSVLRQEDNVGPRPPDGGS